MQGELFARSSEKGWGSDHFAEAFMRSPIAADMDKPFHHAQWAGEAYILSRLSEEVPEATEPGEILDTELLYWCGYLYRYWHFYTGESSGEIFRQAPFSRLAAVYLMYHTMGIEMAIDRLKEISARKS